MNYLNSNSKKILNKINTADENGKKGELKIFFSYVLAAGKTYAMLNAARIAKNLGADVVIGYVRQNLSPETMVLLDCFETIPYLKTQNKSDEIYEFNLDESLKRKPDLIILDNIAHINSNICKNKRRYEDIEELLNAGINVYTTVSVQNLESAADIAASIMKITVEETIPDKILEKASQVEFIDIDPDSLIKRLNEKEIYNYSKKDLSNFFVKENLMALREIALKKIDIRINKELKINKSSYLNNKYFDLEHILVCISASPSNSKVIRTAAKMANSTYARFTALYVEVNSYNKINADYKINLSKNLKLAENLGAKIVTVYGDNIALQISEYAKVSGISKVIIGKTVKTNILQFNKSIVDKLTSLSPNLDIYIIPNNISELSSKNKFVLKKPVFKISDIVKTLSILIICSIIGLIFDKYDFGESNIITIYILGVLLVSSSTEMSFYGVFSSVIGVLAFNFLFTSPRFSFSTYDVGHSITFAVMLTACFIISTLTKSVKNQAKMSASKAYRTEILLETSQMLSRTETMDDIIFESTRQLKKLLNAPIIIYISEKENKKLSSPVVFDEGMEISSNIYISQNEKDIALWVYQNKKIAGATTDIFSESKVCYFPITTKNTVMAVIGIILENNEPLEHFELSLLSAMMNEISFAMEKSNLNKAKNQAQLEAEKERFRANLLRAISHDLRTPLTSISGNVSILLSNNIFLNQDKKKKILEDIYDDSLWLINLVENVLSITRMDNGNIFINSQFEFVQDIISESVSHIDKRRNKHNIKIKNDDEFLMVNVDARLIIQVIINILDNAIKYTPNDSNILIHTYKKDDMAVVKISDNGEGITDENKKQIFNMFFTSKNNGADSRRGLGLGLALCKSIINAHNGEIYVEDNKPKGTVFKIILKAERVNISE